jgi:autotransporter-associated beta strand protein
VQFYSGANLLGQTVTAPYVFTWTNVPAGAYTLYAQLSYDGGSTMSSVPAFVTVNPAPSVPATITPVALSANLVSVSWPSSANADGYVLSRNGAAIASVTGTNYLDFGLSPNTTYSYFVVATNSFGNSSPSVTNAVTTPGSGTARWWDAGGAVAGPQDGNGNWGGSTANWWNGSANVAWTDGSLAVFGSGATTNCYVVITGNVTPSGMLFKPNSGGTYYLSSGGGLLVLSGSPVFNCNDNVNLSTTFGGSGSGSGFTKSGSGTLTLAGANTNSGAIVVSGGRLLATGGGWYGNRSIGSGALTVSNGATAEFTQSHGFGVSNYGQPATLNRGTLQLDGDNYASALTLTAGTI